jgi:hypothetical protein
MLLKFLRPAVAGSDKCADAREVAFLPGGFGSVTVDFAGPCYAIRYGGTQPKRD